jgi:hypothetical protein
VALLAEGDRLNVQVCEALCLRVNNEVLRFSCHELWEEPCAEQLTVERLPPFVMIVLKSILILDYSSVRLYSSRVEELFVDFLIGVDMGTTELVSLPNSFFHFQAVEDGKSNIINEDRLDLAIHAFDEPIHSVEHLHLHAPFTSEGRIVVE